MIHSDARYTVALAAFAAAALFLLWIASNALLLIFAGVVFAAFLHSLAGLLKRVIPAGHGVRLAIVCVVLGLLAGGGLFWGGAALATQADNFASELQQQFAQVASWLRQRGFPVPEVMGDPAGSPAATAQQPAPPAPPPPPPEGSPRDPGADTPSFKSYLPNLQGVFGTAWNAGAVVFGVLGNIFVILFLGIYFAAQPALYRDTALLLAPPRHRRHLRAVLDEAGETLRHFLLGQAVTMTLVFLITWIGLMIAGVQPAFVLALVAGAFEFIPNVGPPLAGGLILLASLGGGTDQFVGALVVVVLAQSLESYLLTPMIQKRAIGVPPAFLFANQVVLGLLFGLYGLALAAPIAAVARVFIIRLYVEDALGDEEHAAPAGGAKPGQGAQ